MIANVLIAIGVVWIYLSILNFVQTMTLHNGIKALELDGDVYGERNGKFLKTRCYVLVAVDDEGYIVGAKKLRTTMYVVPAKLSQMDELVGLHITELDDEADKYGKAVGTAMKKLVVRYKSFAGQRATAQSG